MHVMGVHMANLLHTNIHEWMCIHQLCLCVPVCACVCLVRA